MRTLKILMRRFRNPRSSEIDLLATGFRIGCWPRLSKLVSHESGRMSVKSQQLPPASDAEPRPQRKRKPTWKIREANEAEQEHCQASLSDQQSLRTQLVKCKPEKTKKKRMLEQQNIGCLVEGCSFKTATVSFLSRHLLDTHGLDMIPCEGQMDSTEDASKPPRCSAVGSEEAVDADGDGGPARQPVRTHGVPRQTVQGGGSGQTQTARRRGRPSVLSAEIEAAIVGRVLSRMKSGFPLSNSVLREAVKKCVKRHDAVFPGGRPGDVWLRNFIKRHPRLTWRKAKDMGSAGAGDVSDEEEASDQESDSSPGGSEPITDIVKYCNYSDDSFNNALAAVRGGFSVNEASKMYGIPRQTLRNHVSGRIKRGRGGRRPTSLSAEAEASVADWVMKCAEKGFRITNNVLQYAVQEYVKQHDIPTLFVNGRPTVKWLRGFLNRFPRIDQLKEKSLRVKYNESEDTEASFRELDAFLRSSGLDDVIREPRRVFNSREIGIMLRSDGGNLQCNHCAFRCLEQDILDRHVRKQHGHIGRNARYRCEWCAYSTNHPGNMRDHRRTHTGERPFSCDVCGKTFRVRSNLTEHRRVHTGERPYVCDVCGKTFSKTNSLHSHRRIHTGKAIIVCDHCGVGFYDRSTYLTHARKHGHLNEDEEPKTCAQCGEEFGDLANYTKHMRTHSGAEEHKCEVCSAQFSNQEELILHIRTHPTQSPHCCSFCQVRFWKESDLIKHIQSHT